MFITDFELNARHVFELPEREKDVVGALKLIGKKSLIVCAVTKESGRIYMWNAGEILNSIDKYEH